MEVVAVVIVSMGGGRRRIEVVGVVSVVVEMVGVVGTEVVTVAVVLVTTPVQVVANERGSW